MNGNTIIVDLQGFKNHKNKFLVKELCIATQEHTHIFLIKPPYPFGTLTVEEKRNVRWLENNRGYRWSEGYVDYREFRRIIKPYFKDRKIVVKGEEKVKWIKELCDHDNIVNISCKEIPNFNTLYNLYCKEDSFNCFIHKKYCALKNVLCIRKWCLENDVNV